MFFVSPSTLNDCCHQSCSVRHVICVHAGTAGNVEHGDQYQLKLVYEHNLQRTACNMTYGTFGGVTGMVNILSAITAEKK